MIEPHEDAPQLEAIVCQPPPFKEVSVWAKQVRTDGLAPDFQALFSAVFNSYAETATRLDQERRKDLLENAFLDANISMSGHLFQEGLERRFAGDSSLPRSCYWSVCDNENGDDGGTLLFELLHYTSAWRSGLIGLLDMTLSECKCFSEQFMGINNIGNRLLVELLPFMDGPNPVAEKFRPDIPLHAPLLFDVPLVIRELHFQKAIDLREPSVAAWFASSLSNLRWGDREGVSFPAYLLSPPPTDDFLDVLPSLLDQSTGGSDGTTNIAGLMLRRLGAEALIFPSARSSPSTIGDGRTLSAQSWNIVDYRSSDRSLASMAQTALQAWPKAIAPDDNNDVEVVEHRDDEKMLGWAVKGLRSYNYYARLRDELMLLAKRHQDGPALLEIESALRSASRQVLDLSLTQFAGVKPYALYYLHARLRRALADKAP